MVNPVCRCALGEGRACSPRDPRKDGMRKKPNHSCRLDCILSGFFFLKFCNSIFFFSIFASFLFLFSFLSHLTSDGASEIKQTLHVSWPILF